ncbi:MAG: hypothetical protein KC646_05305 [Candidatus Cloacimonetes bacterium]|nr:hypothetical protein [Candidatus Cloacimonadota bacterium]
MSNELSENQLLQLSEILYSGSKIEAIKYYRSISGQGLKESKEYIDTLYEQLQKENPHKFRTTPSSGCGSTVAVCLMIGYFIC